MPVKENTQHIYSHEDHPRVQLPHRAQRTGGLKGMGPDSESIHILSVPNSSLSAAIDYPSTGITFTERETMHTAELRISHPCQDQKVTLICIHLPCLPYRRSAQDARKGLALPHVCPHCVVKMALL